MSASSRRAPTSSRWVSRSAPDQQPSTRAVTTSSWRPAWFRSVESEGGQADDDRHRQCDQHQCSDDDLGVDAPPTARRRADPAGPGRGVGPACGSGIGLRGSGIGTGRRWCEHPASRGSRLLRWLPAGPRPHRRSGRARSGLIRGRTRGKWSRVDRTRLVMRRVAAWRAAVHHAVVHRARMGRAGIDCAGIGRTLAH